ncbi:acetylornithine deacetylase [Fictibacillus gelatini]|uniref:acetylornithine deacetylase n=1 Tax=Fictibacillus gelatini TaxID=225985 RepID=UPI000413363B|nr:acetylornithine deacetylase [Fictibacillus gelatini]
MLTETFNKKIEQLVEERQDELLQLLGELIRFPTVSPPARNSSEAQQFIEQQLQQLGFTTDKWDVFPNDPNVVGVKKGTDPERFNSLIINGHIDVAEVGDDSEWTASPFEIKVENGYVFGRGTSDMKGGIAGALFAIQLLHELGVELKGDLQFQSVIGEEVGEAGTKSCLDRGYTGDFALVVDTSDLRIQGQGGVITGWITVKSKETFHDGLRSKMIHAGGGLRGASAIEKMMKIISGLQELERHWAVTKSYPGFPAGTNTINPAVIEGGRHAAFIADECRLWITVHFYPNETFEQVAKEIEEHINRVAMADPWLKENPPQFRWGGKSMIEDRGEIFPSLEIDPGHPAIVQLKNHHGLVTKREAEVTMSTSVTDGGWFGWAGIPAAIYGPGELKEAHSVNEKVKIKQLLDYTKTIACFIAEWCNTERGEQK